MLKGEKIAFFKVIYSKRSQKMIRGIVKGTEIIIYDIFYKKKDKEGKMLMTIIVSKATAMLLCL